MSPDLNAIAEEILVAHQRHKGGCLCGWSELGKSHPGHQVAMLCEAGIWNDCAEARAELARCVERLDAADQLVSKAERQRVELRDAHNDLLDVRGILSPAGYEPVTPLSLVPTVAPAVQWLVDRLAAVEQDLNQARAERDQLREELASLRERLGREIRDFAKEAAKTDDPAAILGLICAAAMVEGKGKASVDELADELDELLVATEPSGEADLDPNAPPIEAVLHTLGNVIVPDEPTGRTRCPLCKTLPIGHEGDCEP